MSMQLLTVINDWAGDELRGCIKNDSEHEEQYGNTEGFSEEMKLFLNHKPAKGLSEEVNILLEKNLTCYIASLNIIAGEFEKYNLSLLAKNYTKLSDALEPIEEIINNNNNNNISENNS